MSGNSAADDRRDFNKGGSTGVNLGALREARPRDVAVRFVFGALISAVAGLVGKRFGQHAGGLFLAFPAILPAALTFIEKKDGEDAVHGETIGAVAGALALIAFAGVVAVLATRTPVPLLLLLALVSWVVVATGLYAGLQKLL